MEQLKWNVAVGGLLHDIGKILYRCGDGRDHSTSGTEFLRETIRIEERDILEQVKYHHARFLKPAKLPENSPAYITYLADNIASGADRRQKEDAEAFGFDREIPLDSIFNILNGHQDSAVYEAGTLGREEGIKYPKEQTIRYTDGFYQRILADLTAGLRQIPEGDSGISAILELLEATMTYLPSSTSKKERADISLYDHCKITAAVGCCILDYLQERGISDYRTELLVHEKEFCGKKVFLMYSMDLSGIQEFIYGQYDPANVLKSLRARSFYLDILMEHQIDELLDRLQLSRANLIYSGGGHAYLLLPNTSFCRAQIESFEEDLNQWLLKTFQTELYMASGYVPCSALQLQNEAPEEEGCPQGGYRNIFERLSEQLSQKKMHRYQADALRYLNTRQTEEPERECRICHRSDRLVPYPHGDVGENDLLCPVCTGLLSLSGGILRDRFFAVTTEEASGRMALSNRKYLLSLSGEDKVREFQRSEGCVRVYGKNEMYTGHKVSTRLWVGDYSAGSRLEDLVAGGQGISRLGVLRADIDNLGQAFTSGFPDAYQTLSRSATFSRKMSLFFKLHINDILEQGTFSLDGATPERNATIIYSGGDDIFIVGAWKDILEFAVDLHQSVRAFTHDTLSISAGFGIYRKNYPISYIAAQTGELEDCAKGMEGKNAIALFDEENVYHWDTFLNRVLDEKFRTLFQFFSQSKERGKNFLYNMLDLMRHREEKINLARFAYFLARMEPDSKADPAEKERYRSFSRKMYQWMQEEEDCRETITAIYLYAYLVREGEEENE